MNTTLATITALPVCIPNARLMKLAVDHLDWVHCEAANLASEAWSEFDAAVDRGEPKEYCDDLYSHYMTATALQHETYQQRDEAKRDLLRMYAN